MVFGQGFSGCARKEIAMHDHPFDLDELKAELDEYGFVVLHNLIPNWTSKGTR